MAKRLSPFALIFITVVVDLIGFGIVIPILPLYSERLGATPTVIGFLVAVFSIMQFIFSPILGHLSDRYGRRPVLAASVFGSAGAFLLMGWAQSLWVLFVARALDGITGANISTAQAYIADITTKENRAKGIGVIGAGFGVGFVLGPVIGGAAAHFGPNVPFFVAAVLALLNGIGIVAFLPETRVHVPTEERSLGALHRLLQNHKLRAPMIVYVVAVLSMTMIYATFALFLQRRFGLRESSVGYMFACLGIVGAVTQLRLIGPLVKRLGEEMTSYLGLFGSGLALVLLVLSSTPVIFGLALILYAVTNSLNNTVILAILSQRAPANAQGRVIGMTQGGAGLARATAPILAGWLFERLAVSAPFLISAAVSCLAGVLAVTFIRPEKKQQSSA